jgi:hypothetical protein
MYFLNESPIEDYFPEESKMIQIGDPMTNLEQAQNDFPSKQVNILNLFNFTQFQPQVKW